MAMWAVRTRAILSINPRAYDEASVAQWAGVRMPDEFCSVIATLESVVAVENGKVIGWGMADPKIAQLEALFVDPEFQRRGVATRIYGMLEARSQSAGVRLLKTSATVNSVKFYESVGFSRGSRSRYHHPDGFELDCVQMEKNLDTSTGRTAQCDKLDSR
jgi:ribosomal protein S18 acetylase RimI-like enzyme